MRGAFDISPAKAAVAISYGGGDQELSTTGFGPCRGLYISTAGNLVVRMASGASDTTFTGLLAGTIYPIAVATIRQTGSTAAGLALY